MIDKSVLTATTCPTGARLPQTLDRHYRCWDQMRLGVAQLAEFAIWIKPRLSNHTTLGSLAPNEPTGSVPFQGPQPTGSAASLDGFLFRRLQGLDLVLSSEVCM
jgi:hypothetical protein